MVSPPRPPPSLMFPPQNDPLATHSGGGKHRCCYAEVVSLRSPPSDSPPVYGRYLDVQTLTL
jgi:hypothetical protein